MFAKRTQVSTGISDISIFFTGLKMEIRGLVKPSYSLSVKWTAGEKEVQVHAKPYEVIGPIVVHCK